jgi:hypothetical protein
VPNVACVSALSIRKSERAQEWTMSRMDNVKNEQCQEWTMSRMDNVKNEQCQEWKMSRMNNVKNGQYVKNGQCRDTCNIRHTSQDILKKTMQKTKKISNPDFTKNPGSLVLSLSYYLKSCRRVYILLMLKFMYTGTSTAQ